ncbi:TonB-dependent receptor [Solimonas terrae]|uniref:TonB-dependent receptor n=1 Tax=Solimonas terrae TaxID=1396819 RepID=A0A6M2BPI8_9GAMM|nr:TonB-dependent receptor [Solimonas terrae]NGY04105.1 TonB-dependent receptor [Solimonas terrae]
MRVHMAAAAILMLATGIARAQDESAGVAGSAAADQSSGSTDAGPADSSSLSSTSTAADAADASGGDAVPADARADANPTPPSPPGEAAADAPTSAPPSVVATIPVPQNPPPVPPGGSAAAPQQIAEIVVTATKREQSLRQIPASITALGGADLERRGAQGVEDIARLVPGVNFTADSVNASQVTIRGISTTTLGNPTTGVLFGDVSFTDAYLPRVTLDPNPFDMKSVEVLKGPQGTLFGSAALNGAIRYVPEPPKFGEYETRWFAQYSMVDGGGEAPTYGAAVNLPFGDELALRMMAFKRKSPGWIDNTHTGEHDINSVGQEGARGILGWRPGDNLDVHLSYVWQQTNVRDSPYAEDRSGELTRDTTSRPSPVDSQYRLADLVARYSFESMDLVSDTAWVDKSAHKALDASTDLTGSTFPYVLLDDVDGSDTYSQELRLVSTDTSSPWRWVTGVFGMHQSLNFVPEYSVALTPGFDLQALAGALDLPIQGLLAQGDSVNLLRVRTQATIEELALFGDVTRRLGDSVELSIGGRLYHSRSGGSVLQDGALVLLTGALQNDNRGVIKASGFNPKASALWHITHDVLVYTAVSKGFRNGGLQPGFTTPLSAKQAPDRFTADTLWNYEAGTRTQWLDNTLHVDATAFYVDWKNPQILLGDSVLHLPYLDNAGRVKSVGIETAVQWLPAWAPGLSINASAAWTRTETAEAFEGQTGATLPKGTPWPYAARWQTATTVSYAHEFGDWTAEAGVTHSWLSKAWADLEQTEPVFDYQQWDAQLNLSNAAIRWLPEIGVTVSNLANERGIANVIVGGVVTRVDKVTYIQPRAVLLRLSGSF